MEYVKSLTAKLHDINENNIRYFNMLEKPEFIFGTPSMTGEKVDFFKYTSTIRDETYNYDERVRKEFSNLCRAASGCRIRLKTDSSRIIFKVALRREWDNAKLTLWSSSGFDVYDYEKGLYTHRTVFGPKTGKNFLQNH